MTSQSQSWTRPQADVIFKIDGKTKNLELLTIPPVARKVKIHICAQSGHCKDEHVVSWQFSTFQDMTQITARTYKQDAWSVCNEVVTLQLDDRKVIDVTRIGGYPDGHFFLTVQVLGYK